MRKNARENCRVAGDYASLMLLRNESIFVVGKCASEAVLNGTRAFRNRPLGA
jgi:hypothetical protein